MRVKKPVDFLVAFFLRKTDIEQQLQVRKRLSRFQSWNVYAYLE